MVAKGSVDEIKKRFGIGYNVIVNKANFDDHLLIQKLHEIVPGSYKDSNSNSQKCIYVLPFQAVDKFPQFFEYLESQDIKFTLKQTSLEDAFLNFTNLKNADPDRGQGHQDVDNEALSPFKEFNNFANLDQNPPRAELSSTRLFCLQFRAMFLKRWYSFKRDWRMWLIMVLPSIIITLFLFLGFQREYRSPMELKYSSQLLGNNSATNATDLSPDQMNDAITNMATLTAHGNPISSGLAEKGSNYFKDIMENPSLENIMKNIINLQKEDDEEFKEIKAFIADVMKEDLKMQTPFELVTYAMTLMTKAEDDRTKEMQGVAQKIQVRV